MRARNHGSGQRIERRRWILPIALSVVLMLPLFHTAPARAFQTGVTDADIASLLDQDAPQTQSGVGLPSSGKLLTRLGISLAAVFGLIVLAAWLAKKYLPAQMAPGRTGPIEVISTRTIAPRKSLMLVRVQDKTVLLGVTAQGLQFLTDVDQGHGGWADAAVQGELERLATSGIEGGRA